MTKTDKLCRDCMFWNENGDQCHAQLPPSSAREQRNPGWLRSIIDSDSFCGKDGKRFMPSIDSAIRSNRFASRVFLFTGENPVSPRQFGLVVVKMAIDTTRTDVEDMIGKGESTIQKRIASRAQVAHLHLLVLQTVVYYVYAGKFLALQKDVLTEVYEGVMEGFRKLLVDGSGQHVGDALAELLHKLFAMYGNSLYQEASEELSGNPFDLGSTSSLVIDGIASQCDIETLLNPMEKLRLQLIAARCGIHLLLMLWKDKSITFVA